ncbi:hypothetical protein [Albibacterium profundi]|uniref:Uncharacterized protein n=1 Tax=Albibacterium profundi TaxID=3134906 RepID=A0ABV5CGJ3_9SPHI
MLISTAPIVISFSDSEFIINVMMQLELEGKAQGSVDAKEIPVTGYILPFNELITHILQASFNLVNERDIIAFFPSVPTPPPNFS